ncbi:MAG: ABC transporter permease [Candidatus Cloacimonetes bacterium]|nr:ABC transporter permease [Candidatus Cloacimonadota bacterium]
MFKKNFTVALRNIFRSKVHSFINITGLAIGIASCLLIMLYIKYERSYEKMFTNAERIYRVLTIDKALGTNKQRVGITMPALGPVLAEKFPEIEAGLRVTGGGRFLLQYEDNEGIYAQTMKGTDSNFFDFFDYTFLQGDPETALVEPFSIVLTNTMKEMIFKNENPLGKKLKSGFGEELTVTGVIPDPPENSFLQFNVLVSLSTYATLARRNQPPDSPNPIWLESWGLVAMPTYMMLEKEADITGLNERITQLCRDNDVSENFDITLQPLLDVHLYSTDMIFDPIANKGDAKNIYIFAAIAILILVIAAVNYMNLSTARSLQRAREVGMRKIVGSSLQQLRWQFLGESLLVSFMAIIIAYPLMEITLPLLNDLAGTKIILAGTEFLLVIGAMLILWLVVGAGAGFYPAMVLSAYKPLNVIRGTFTAGKGGNLIRRILVVTQFILSVALIGMTVVIQQQMYFITHKDVGYNREQILVFDVLDREIGRNLPVFKEALAGFSSIVSLSEGTNVPGRTFGRTGLTPEGSGDEDIWIWNQFAVDNDYYNTLGMEISRGRNFYGEGEGSNDNYVMINETAARQLNWDNPLGKRIYFDSNDSTGVEVIGVVRDFHFMTLHQNIEPVIIFPLNPGNASLLLARIRPGHIAPALEYAEGKWKEIYPNHPFNFSFLDEEFDNLYHRDLNAGKVVNIFTGLAIFVACLGLLGLTSHSTILRTKEIGIRKVLGSSISGIIRLLIFDFLRWVLLANLIALPLTWFISKRWLEGFAYRIDLSVMTFLYAALISIFAALITIGSLTFRAAYSNPVDALKYE